MTHMSAPERGHISARRALPRLGGEASSGQEAPTYPHSRLFDRSQARPAHAESPAGQSDASGLVNVRSQIAQEAAAIPMDEGVTYIGEGKRGQQNRPRSMKRNGILTPVTWDTFTVDNPDGTQDVYLERHMQKKLQVIGRVHPQEKGVWREVWSEPQGRSGKRKLLEGPERVGEAMGVGVEKNPDGTTKSEAEVYSREYIQKLQEKALEKQQRLQQALATIPYAANEHDRLLQEASKDQLRALLKNTKETTGQQIVKTVQLIAVNGTSSAIFWLPHLLPGPNAELARFPLSLGISFLGNTLLNKAVNANEMQTQMNVVTGAALAGFGIGSLIPIPFASFIGAGVGILGATGLSLLERRNQLKRLAKEHPELSKAALKELRRDENYTKYMDEKNKGKAQKEHAQILQRINAYQRFGKVPQYSQEFFTKNQELAKQILSRVPDLNPIELGLAIDQLHLKNQSTDVAAYYLQKGTKGMMQRLFIPLAVSLGFFASQGRVPILGDFAQLVIGKAPLALTAVFTTWGSIINPLIMHRKVKAVREEMKQKNPELLQELTGK